MDEEVPILAIVPCKPEDRLPGTQDVPYKQSPFHIPYECEYCSVEGWIGPRQLTLKKTKPETLVLCTNCLVKLGGTNVFDNLKHLGGP